MVIFNSLLRSSEKSSINVLILKYDNVSNGVFYKLTITKFYLLYKTVNGIFLAGLTTKD